MNVSAFDLNLLKVFAAIYAERNVTRAADKVGLAQPSMSNALSRLRAVFDDQLFVKTPGGMVPTERAHALAPSVETALAKVQEAFGAVRGFDPATTKASLTIAAPDNLTLRIAPELTHRLAKQAPGIDLRFRAFDKDAALGQLDRSEIDVALGQFPDVPPRFHLRDLFEDRFVVIARAGHPAVAGRLSLKAYCAAGHVLVSFRGDARGAVDGTLARLGRQRRIALVLAQFGLVPDIVARTDYLATMPASIAEALAPRSGCTLQPLPFAQAAWTNQAVWSAVTHAEPAKRYAIDALLAAAGSNGRA